MAWWNFLVIRSENVFNERWNDLVIIRTIDHFKLQNKW